MQDNNIDVVVHADAKDDDRYSQMYKVPQDLGKFVRLDYTSEISTTDIIARVQAISMDATADN